MRLSVRGRVFSGMGKGRYYVGHQEYQRRFAERLGYSPFPGTLNLKLEDPEVVRSLDRLRKEGGVKIPPFSSRGESFSALTCFDGELRGEKVTLLFIDVTYYNETVAELISPVYLRERLGLKDGDQVEFTVEATGTTPGTP